MKNIFLLLTSVLHMFFAIAVNAQSTSEEKLNLPGDNLNLYAVLNLFQESETLELFENNLNKEDSKINNLDLNNDDKIDYIRVIDNVDGDNHFIVLQVAINEKENQDVAVFSVNKDKNKQLQIQVIGDESLYGKDYIIEPNSPDSGSKGATPNPGYSTNATNAEGKTVVVEKTIIVQVQTWPVITYMYTPAYVRWNSPWYWGYYPSYWNPWRPYYWDYYYGYHYNWHAHYHGHYHSSHYYRNPLYRNNYYSNNRSQSSSVRNNNNTGIYKKTYSRPDLRKQGVAEFNTKHKTETRPSFPTSRNSGSINESNQVGNANLNQENKTETRPAARPETRPAARPAARPETRPAPRPAARPETRPAARPAARPETRPAPRPAPSPAARPAPRPAARPAFKSN